MKDIRQIFKTFETPPHSIDLTRSHIAEREKVHPIEAAVEQCVSSRSL
jgi:hypothetical protein